MKGNKLTTGASVNKRTILPFIMGVFLSLVLASIAAGTGTVTRVSTDSTGGEANYESWSPSLSADARYVAFESYASNLVPDDTNSCGWMSCPDIFVKDTQTNNVIRVSTDSTGAQANDVSWDASLSSDGRFVSFMSAASNLVVSDTNHCDWGTSCADVFFKDSSTGNIMLASYPGWQWVDTSHWEYDKWVSSGYWDEVPADYASDDPAISADGRFVAFSSEAGNLIRGDDSGALGDTNGCYWRSCSDIFVKNILTGQLTRVSTDSMGGEANNESYRPAISADGRYVAFESWASNLVPGDTNNSWDIFVKDTQTGATTRVSTDATGVEGNGSSANSFGQSTSISADGRYVAFVSQASNLVPDDTNGTMDVFVKDIQTGLITRVSTDSESNQVNGDSGNIGTSVSADGRFVAFDSNSCYPSSDCGIYVKDRSTGQSYAISTGGQFTSETLGDSYIVVSADGSRLSFSSFDSNLVPNDINESADIFLVENPAVSSCAGAKPPLALSIDDVYWASYADYEARTLNVDYSLSNSGNSAYIVQVTSASATAGVVSNTGIPVSLGNIIGGSSHSLTLKYTVPSGATSFTAGISASAQDECGNGYTYP